MKGDPTLWVPGTDHAAIATEVKVVDALKAEGLTKKDVGREEFLRRTWEWKKEYGGRIVRQLRKLGVSCDWKHERFTMDDGLSRAVRETFVNLYEKGLIYRGNRIINWCPDLPDRAVRRRGGVRRAGFLCGISAIPAPDGDDGAWWRRRARRQCWAIRRVAVNPSGRALFGSGGQDGDRCPFVNREIPVVADDYVDMEFGTGVVKITPAHDPNDFEVGHRHNLPVIRVMNDDGTMNENAGEFAGMDRYEARKAIVASLKEMGMLHKVEPHKHNVGSCYRCHTTVEPHCAPSSGSSRWSRWQNLPLRQLRTAQSSFIPNVLKKLTSIGWRTSATGASAVSCGGDIVFPCGTATIAARKLCEETDPTVCPKCGSKHIHQDEDVLDTWFSSALWPFSTLGSGRARPRTCKAFFPTSRVELRIRHHLLLGGAHDVHLGWSNMGEVPFNDVLMHGIVRDEQGPQDEQVARQRHRPRRGYRRVRRGRAAVPLARVIAPGQ